MELVVNTDGEPEKSVQYKFGKMIVGAAVSFVATALAERLFDTVAQLRQGKATVELEK